jgi:hypothetical protein
MDETKRKIKVFAIEEEGNGYVTLLGEFNTLEEIIIRPADFSKDVQIEFEEYWIGQD